MKKFIKKVMGLGVIAGLLVETFPVWALVKDETIYAKLDNNGQVNQVIVSEHLQGTGEKETFDKSRLEEIKNVNGDEKFTKENNKLVWESNGKDIYYQGKTREELPISLKISYYFNGEESTIKDMLGKKGSVRIVLKYTNNDKHEEMINGKSTTLYTPFVVATTTILSNDTNKNINVKNGRVIGNGTSSIVVLLSTPGLYESLGLEKLKGMDTAEISFDTESFSLSSIYSLSTPKLIEKSDLEIFNNVDGIYNSINTLIDSSNKLKSGSGQVLDGASKLKEGVTKLKDGIDSAYNGSKRISDTVNYSVNSLNESPAITDEQLNKILSEVQGTVNDNFGYNPEQMTIEQYAKFAALKKVNETFTKDYNENIENIALDKLAEDDEYSQMKGSIAYFEKQAGFLNLVTVCTSGEIPQEYQATCAANMENIETYQTLKGVVEALEKTAKETAVETAYQTALTVTEEAIKTLYTNVYGTATKTATDVANGVADSAKTKTIESLQLLQNGLDQLTNGLNEINNRMVDLDTGTSSLKEGISALDNGLSQFNSQGMGKISSLVNGDVKTLEEKIKALGKLSINYGTFDDSESGTEGTSKIIMIVDEISANQTHINIVDKITKDNESLWEKIKENLNKDKNK